MPQSSQRVEGIELKHIHIVGFSLYFFSDFSAASKNSMGGFTKAKGFMKPSWSRGLVQISLLIFLLSKKKYGIFILFSLTDCGFTSKLPWPTLKLLPENYQ